MIPEWREDRTVKDKTGREHGIRKGYITSAELQDVGISILTLTISG